MGIFNCFLFERSHSALGECLGKQDRGEINGYHYSGHFFCSAPHYTQPLVSDV